MKKIILLSLLALLFCTIGYAQEYKMGIELNDGTKITLNTNDVKELSFLEGKLVVSGGSLTEKIDKISQESTANYSSLSSSILDIINQNARDKEELLNRIKELENKLNSHINNSTGGNNSGSQSTKRISKIIKEENNHIDDYTLSYDSQGRVVKIFLSGTNDNSVKTYQYGENQIVTQEEGTVSNKISFTETHRYTLDNGLIIKDEEETSSSNKTAIYSYDTNGYLVSISEEGSSTPLQTKQITWNDGNLTGIDSRSYTYSTIPWEKGFPFYLDGSNIDEYLFSLGYFGNTPKFLPSNFGTQTSEYTCDYTIQDNIIKKIVITGLNYSSTFEITYIWE